MKKQYLTLFLAILGIACSPRISCPDLASAYEGARQEKPRLKRASQPERMQSATYVETASLSVTPVVAPRPELSIASTRRQLELLEIVEDEEKLSAGSTVSYATERLIMPADTTITPWTEDNFEEIKRAQKRGRTSLLLALLFPVALFIPFVNFITVPMAIGGVVLGTMSLKTFKKYGLKRAKGKLAAVLGTVINWAWIILSIAAILVVIWFLLAFGL